MTRQADDAYIMCIILTAELSTETDTMCFFQHLFFQFYIAESTSVLISGSRQIIIKTSRSQFHSQQVLFSRCTTDYKCNVVRRTSSCTQSLHFLNQERNQSSRIQDSLGFLIQISLVGRTTTLSHAQEFIFHSLSSLNINLSRQVATGVHFLIHGKRSILRITQVFFRISLVYTQ